MCNVRDLGPYFVFGAWQHFMTAKETQQESGQGGRQGDRERQSARERAPQTFDFAKSCQRYAQKCTKYPSRKGQMEA